MLNEDKVIALFCFVDDLLKCIDHKEDVRTRVSDSEVITTAFVSVMYFGGHQDNARMFMKRHVPKMLDKSRFCRRLHRLSNLILLLFERIGRNLKNIAGAADYVLDSFPVQVCDNIRIARSKIFKGESAWRGKHAAMRRYFYGVRVQVLTLWGVPVEFCIVPGRESDNLALNRLPIDIAPESNIYADSGYLNYEFEDMMTEVAISFRAQRRSNSHRKDEPHLAYLKEKMRKEIETTFSIIKARMLRSLHAVTKEGFMIKVMLFVVAYSFEKLL